MGNTLRWVMERLSERSTWEGAIAAVGGAFFGGMSESTENAIAGFAVAAVGVVRALWPDIFSVEVVEERVVEKKQDDA